MGRVSVDISGWRVIQEPVAAMEQILREIAEAFRNLIRPPQPQPVPVPVRVRPEYPRPRR